MNFISTFSDLQLDIIGIVAILGEGSTQRNAQASALSWYHILPRLYPAPQALLKHHQEKNLPVENGIIVGALSGRIRNELNFFTQLLHSDDLQPYSVQILEVNRKEKLTTDKINNTNTKGQRNSDVITPAFEVKKFGHLAALSILGFCMSMTLIALSVWQKDGPALTATILLSATSTSVGLASWSTLDVKEEMPNAERKGKVPLGDVVIFYPKTGAFRVIRCTDQVSRLYFRVEECEHYFGDNMYRTIALFSTVMLMGGLIMLGNSKPILQAAFAASYVVLNVLYWASSARNPALHVWKHDFEKTEIGFTRKMVMNKSGMIVPQQSELSPVDCEFSPSSRSIEPEYYFNRHWKQKLLARTSTMFSVGREEEQRPPVERSGDGTFIEFVMGGWRAYLPWPKQTQPPTQGSVLEEKTAVNGKPADGGHATKKGSQEGHPRSLTSALWTVIAVTGSSSWARSTNIAPNNEVWDKWLKEAEEKAVARYSRSQKTFVPACMIWEDAEEKKWISLPFWNYQTRLSELFREQSDATRKRFEEPHAISEMEKKLERVRRKLTVVIALRILCQRWKKKKELERQTAVQI
ncbi:hypothetical protein H2198_005599 [Neophaeococcomyces mojaviensis]|uniref:Uncharacterized protein n=1 Tax=Neophaeococcomyces mojaviensis TaxID=3383035 RepID=A0ACC3A5E5_9EURO|nr:hypothetical protein H2198_005599 [Knufia sp. JES_112]